MIDKAWLNDYLIDSWCYGLMVDICYRNISSFLAKGADIRFAIHLVKLIILSFVIFIKTFDG